MEPEEKKLKTSSYQRKQADAYNAKTLCFQKRVFPHEFYQLNMRLEALRKERNPHYQAKAGSPNLYGEKMDFRKRLFPNEFNELNMLFKQLKKKRKKIKDKHLKSL